MSRAPMTALPSAPEAGSSTLPSRPRRATRPCPSPSRGRRGEQEETLSDWAAHPPGNGQPVHQSLLRPEDATCPDHDGIVGYGQFPPHFGTTTALLRIPRREPVRHDLDGSLPSSPWLRRSGRPSWTRDGPCVPIPKVALLGTASGDGSAPGGCAQCRRPVSPCRGQPTGPIDPAIGRWAMHNSMPRSGQKRSERLHGTWGSRFDFMSRPMPHARPSLELRDKKTLHGRR